MKYFVTSTQRSDPKAVDKHQIDTYLEYLIVALIKKCDKGAWKKNRDMSWDEKDVYQKYRVY